MEYLCISYLSAGQGDMFVSSPFEKELMDLFSQLMPDTQEYLLIMAKELLKMQENIHTNQEQKDA